MDSDWRVELQCQLPQYEKTIEQDISCIVEYQYPFQKLFEYILQKRICDLESIPSNKGRIYCFTTYTDLSKDVYQQLISQKKHYRSFHLKTLLKICFGMCFTYEQSIIFLYWCGYNILAKFPYHDELHTLLLQLKKLTPDFNQIGERLKLVEDFFAK